MRRVWSATISQPDGTERFASGNMASAYFNTMVRNAPRVGLPFPEVALVRARIEHRHDERGRVAIALRHPPGDKTGTPSISVFHSFGLLSDSARWA